MHLSFVCTGNICRSPMAAIVVGEHLRRAGLSDVVVTSAGVGPWHVGKPADPRAAQTLAEHGYPTEHVAAQVDAEHLAADLLVALDAGHLADLRALGAENVRLLRSFDPDAGAELDVPDPYYGGRDGFTEVLAMIEAAAPALVDWARSR